MTSFLFAMEYKTGESTGRWFSSRWLLITFTHQGKCITREGWFAKLTSLLLIDIAA
jgi:hypothetical protein